MVTCENSSYFIFIKITSSWSQFMLSTVQHFTESISVKTHSNSCHLSNSVASVNHMSTPSIHDRPKFREIIRSLVGISFFNFIISANVPEISPFGIKWRRRRSDRLVLFTIGIEAFSMILGFLFIFWSCTNLKVVVRIYVFGRFICIVIF